MKKPLAVALALMVATAFPFSGASATDLGQEALDYIAGVSKDIESGLLQVAGDPEKEYAECRKTFEAHFLRRDVADTVIDAVLADATVIGDDLDSKQLAGMMWDYHCIKSIDENADNVSLGPPTKVEPAPRMGDDAFKVHTALLEDGEKAATIVWFVKPVDGRWKIITFGGIDETGRSQPTITAFWREELRDLVRHFDGDFWASMEPFRQTIAEVRKEKTQAGPSEPSGPLYVEFPRYEVDLKSTGCAGKTVAVAFSVEVASVDDEVWLMDAIPSIDRAVLAHLQSRKCGDLKGPRATLRLNREIAGIIDSQTREGMARAVMFTEFQSP